MAKIPRITNKIFGETATATGSDPEIGQFGSALAGTYNGTTDIATIQSLNAWSNGFIGAVTASNQYPALPEMTGFGKVLSQQTGYLYQSGIPEWDSGTTYYTNSFCQVNGYIYRCENDNVSGTSPTTDTTNWTNLGRTFLNQNQITNCILKDPQNINLTLSGGTLTLKAGSVVCVPNGFESDGTTPKFDEVTVSSDTIITNSFSSAWSDVAIIRSSDGTLNQEVMSTRFCSGSTDTLSSLSGIHFWYDTSTNLVKQMSGTTQQATVSFPFCLMTNAGSGGGFTSITQTFQSVGYIGSTVFVRKGLKVLMPNGRNTDGSLKNIEYNVSNTKIFTQNRNVNTELITIDNSGTIALIRTEDYFVNKYPSISSSTWASVYDTSLNQVLITSYGSAYSQKVWAIIGTCTTTSGVISNLKQYSSANLVEYNQLGSYILDMFYPVNSLYITVDTSSVCPLAKFGGTWQLVGQDRVLQGASSASGAGGTKAAGLPNIYGEINNSTYGVAWVGATTLGAFTNAGTAQHDNGSKTGSDNQTGTIIFNANNSNSIYRDGSTVQPPALLVNIWQRTA